MGYSYKATITIDHTKCGASDSSNFPVLVFISDTRLKTVGNGGSIQHTGTQSGGNAVTMPFDLIFSSDSAGVSLIPWEIDSYDGTLGILWAWVKIATVSHTVNTSFYSFFGNTSINTQQNVGSFSVANVWNSNFIGVWHFPDGSTLNVNDSTANGLNGVTHNIPTAAIGKIDGGLGLASASSQYVSVTSNASMNSSNFSASAWFNTSTIGAFQDIQRRDNGGSARSFILRITNANKVEGLLIYGTIPSVDSTTTYTDGIWHHAVMTVAFSGATSTLTLYVDGVSQGTVATNAANPTITQQLDVGIFSPSASEAFNGTLDECRFAQAALSADWILTEYNNQSSPGTFLSISIAAISSGTPTITLLGCGA